jgi:hypothetical protein
MPDNADPLVTVRNQSEAAVRKAAGLEEQTP